MARRVLIQRTASIAALALSLSACQRHDHAPIPLAESAAVAASASHFVAQARAAHFEAELKRARDHWQAKPSLGDCGAKLHEKADIELCQAAATALAAIEQEPGAALERTLPTLADGALALARLSQRVRFLSLSELSDKRLTGDAGAPHSAPPAPPPAPSGSTHEPSLLRALRGAQRAGRSSSLELSDGPVSQLMALTVRLERDTVRNLGAYLEYAELPVRRSAFETVKRLHDERPQWAVLDHLLREAALLESDSDLKHELQGLVASGLPHGHPPGQSPASK